jgi:hypothetical protein
MHVVGDRDRHTVKVLLLLVEHLSEVAVEFGLEIFGGCFLEMLLVNVAQGVGVLTAHTADVAGALHAAHADRAEVGFLAGRRAGCAAQHVPGHDHASGGRRGGAGRKLAPGQGGVRPASVASGHDCCPSVHGMESGGM